MKRIIAAVLLFALTISTLSACRKTYDAEEILSEFIAEYGAEGVIYHSGAAEGECGYLEPEMLRKIYVIGDRFPGEYAIFLNSHSGYGSECAVFICQDAEEQLAAEEAAFERIRLLSGGEGAFVKRSGSVVFYSTMSDGERATEIFEKIIK